MWGLGKGQCCCLFPHPCPAAGSRAEWCLRAARNPKSTAPGFLGWWDCTQSTSPGVAEQCRAVLSTLLSSFLSRSRAGKMHPTPPLPWEEK